MEEIVNIQSIDPITFELQTYSLEDTSLILSNNISTQFNSETDYLEYFIYDLNQNILIENITGYPNFTLLDNQVTIDPETDLKSFGFTEGQYNTVYNFLRRRAASSALDRYYIDQISSDRTEIRLNTTTIPNSEVVASVSLFSQEIQNSQGGYLDFYLDFGNNQLIIANNILLDNSNPNDPTVLIKLYEPLPSEFNIKSECWVVEQIAESVAYNINITPVFNIEDDNIPLKGPNYNLSISDQINNSTQYTNLSSLTVTTSATGSGSLRYQLNSLLAENNIELNINYSSYNNFIHFSSAQTRLENFYYKLALIEQYTYSASLSTNTTTNYYVSSSNVIYQAKINEIITNFDGYEYYLYYESGSTAWPKTNSTPPYTNASTTNPSTGYTWFVSQSAVAELYDSQNNNALINAIPSYLREDPNNSQFELFVEMIGQHFDNIFSYLQGVTEKYNADNRLNYGVSKDLVADILRDLGIKIYQNNFSTDDLYAALIGITPSGSLFNLPYTTPSLPAPTGFDYITTYVTASATGSLQPTDDINKSIYKRLYHNIPLLLKKKGTVAGTGDLITSCGIPNTILRINEYGGKDKDNSNDWDYGYNQYNYAYTQNGNNFISSSWQLNTTWGAVNNVPTTIAFRFKTNSLPTSNIPYSQSLWELYEKGVSFINSPFAITLKYTGSGYTTSSFISSSADPINPYYQYAKLDFIPNLNIPNISASIYLPFFNKEWWSVMLTRNNSTNLFTLYSKNSINNQIGFQASSSVLDNNIYWGNANNISYFGDTSTPNYTRFSGSFQEIRYYTTRISESVFDDYVINPNSIEGNGTNQGPNQLAFRASLGGELYTGSTSIHPKVTGSWATTSSFAGNSNFFYSGSPTFIANSQSVFFDQPPVGIKNPVSDKIKQQSVVLPYSSSLSNIPTNTILSPFRSIQQDYSTSQSYTKNINYVEVGFSPQNEINDDINSQIGYINIGDYIGDPRLVSSSATSYPTLDALRDEYFKKYTHNYDINDYIRLIKYFDNSLFKMIKDFTPARAGLASGVIIKQHILERNKYPVPQATPNTPVAYYGSGSGNNIAWNTPFVFQNLLVSGAGVRMYEVTGSNAGVFPNLNGLTSSFYTGNNVVNITQSWGGTTMSPLGLLPFTQSSQIEFFNGELSGSNLVVTNGDLNGDNPFLNVNPITIQYNINTYDSTQTTIRDFLAPISLPAPGGMFTYYEWKRNSYAGGQIGLSYIIINSTDIAGNDNILYLRNILRISIPLNNVFKQYIVTNKTEYNGYFILKLIPNPNNSDFNTQNSIYSNTFITFEPTSIIPFTNTDYDALMNNAGINRISNIFSKVDYVNNPNVPVNLPAIISESATPASVQDSNYTLARQINSRYIGKELQSQEFNQWNIGDTSYGQTPNVSNPKTYFTQFNWLGGTSPEWGNNFQDKTQASIRFIIDENGNKTIPINDPDQITLRTIEQSFVEGQNAIAQLSNPTEFGVDMSNLNGTFTVFKAGKKIKPIVYTQKAIYDSSGTNVVGFTYTGSIEFVQGGTPFTATGGPINDYKLLAFAYPYDRANLINSYNGTATSSPLQQVNTQIPISWNSPQYLGLSGSFVLSSTAPITGSVYQPTGSLGDLGANGYSLIFDISINYRSQVLITPSSIGWTSLIAYIRLQKSIDNGVNWTSLRSSLVTHPPVTSFSNTLRLNYTDNFATTSSLYRVVRFMPQSNIRFLSTPYFGKIDILPNSYFTVTQYPVSNVGKVTRFWYTGSGNNKNLLYAQRGTVTLGPGAVNNVGLNDVWGSRQQDINRSGFESIVLDFEPQEQDEIRFEGVENQSYTIFEVSQSFITPPGSAGYEALTLVLDKDITPNVNTDYFLLRRYVDDPSNIIIDVDKPSGGTSGGILKPEFITTQTEKQARDAISSLLP